MGFGAKLPMDLARRIRKVGSLFTATVWFSKMEIMFRTLPFGGVDDKVEAILVKLCRMKEKLK